MKRALFLDRDGIINDDRHYVHEIKDFYFIDGIFDICRAAIDAGMVIIVVTNQAGIGRGIFTESQFHLLTDWMNEQFADRGLKITQVYYCPHHPVHGVGPYRLDCQCRKPNPGMILRARNEHNFCLRKSILIGDKEGDIVAAKAADVGTTVRISDNVPTQRTGPDYQFRSVREALQILTF